MTRTVLIVSPDAAIAGAIEKTLIGDPDVEVTREATTLAAMNGRAVEAASRFDVILFQTAPDSQADVAAIRAVSAAKSDATRLIALADGSVTLSEARVLTEAGVDEVLPLAGTGRARPAVAAASRNGKIIAVAQARGGIGATTVAVNLADQLARGAGLPRKATPPKVALLDLDLQFGTVGSYLDLPEQDTLHQLALEGTIPDAHFLAQSMPHMDNGVAVLVAPPTFAPLDALKPAQVAAILDTLRASHDIVIVDLPRALVGWIEPIVERTDDLLIVTDVAVSSVRHCRRLIDFFTQDNPALQVEVVVNHHRQPFFTSPLQREVAQVLERPLKHWLPHDPRAAAAASGRGQPLSRAAPRSALSRGVARLAAAVGAGFVAPSQPSVQPKFN